MDEQLKARLIGAVILVALAVLFVPELLSGRKPPTPATAAEGQGRGTRTYTIDLSGAASPQSTAVPSTPPAPEPKVAGGTPAPALPRAEEAPSTGTPAAPVPATSGNTGSTASAAPPPAPAPQAKPAKPAARGGWSVQVGAFSSVATAGKLVADLESAGYPAYLAPISKGGKTLQRVRVGPVAARAEADRLAERLKARALPATVVAND